MCRVIPRRAGERDATGKGRAQGEIASTDTPAVAQSGSHAAERRAADVKTYAAQPVFGFPAGQSDIQRQTLLIVTQ